MEKKDTNIERAAPKAAPEEIPKEKGSTIGLRKIACRTAPETAKAAPTMKVSNILGNRTCHKMVAILSLRCTSFSDS